MDLKEMQEVPCYKCSRMLQKHYVAFANIMNSFGNVGEAFESDSDKGIKVSG